MSAPAADPFVPALLIIDLQNDFVSGSLSVPGGDAVVAPINALASLPFTTKIATRDWHPANHASFAATHGASPFSTTTLYHPTDTHRKDGKEQVLWPVHCVQDTPGARFVDGLRTGAVDDVVSKGTEPGVESYSAFQDIWQRDQTALAGLLRARKVTDVYVAGLAGDYCVKWTAVDAVRLGYNVWLVEEAIKSIGSQEEAFEEMKKLGIKVTSVAEVQAKIPVLV